MKSLCTCLARHDCVHRGLRHFGRVSAPERASFCSVQLVHLPECGGHGCVRKWPQEAFASRAHGLVTCASARFLSRSCTVLPVMRYAQQAAAYVSSAPTFGLRAGEGRAPRGRQHDLSALRLCIAFVSACYCAAQYSVRRGPCSRCLARFLSGVRRVFCVRRSRGIRTNFDSFGTVF